MATKIIDSTGKTVGTFISFLNNETALVELRINNKNYLQPVYPDRIGNESSGVLLYYTELGCSGQAYIEYNTDNNFGFFKVYELTSLGWLIKSPDGVTPQSITTVSTGETSSPACSAQTITHDVITIQQATGPDFRAGFTPPFSVEL